MGDEAFADFVANAEAGLAPFLNNNPSSKIGEGPKTNVPFVLKPWGDETVVLELPPGNGKIIEVLNNIILPERYSALRHIDTGFLEVIFTAYPLRGAFAEVTTRSFDFIHKGHTYKCRYGEASDELLAIADLFIPTGPQSSTAYRNLGSFKTYMLSKQDDQSPSLKKYFEQVTPICFWI